MKVVGFEDGLLGACSVVHLVDDSGIFTSCKVLNGEELKRIQADPSSFIGRKLLLDYQEKTPDGMYRHPRWDRWVEDGE
jgi:hypothetical protein